ncbi:Lipase-like pad4 [Asimina triloba]
MLAVFLASTPLLSDAWRQCSTANATVPGRFVTHRVGDVAYVAFSGIPRVQISNWDSSFAPLHAGSGSDAFSLLGDHDGEPPMVHAGFLRIFQSIFESPAEFSQVLETVNSNRAVVFTGHSIGGAIASLATLWLLSSFPSLSSSVSLLCVTFGSPLLGNEALSRAILTERWGGRFCHVVAKHDIVPRLLFAPLSSMSMQLNQLLEFWHLRMKFPQMSGRPIAQLSNSEIYLYVLDHLAAVDARVRAKQQTEEDSASACCDLYTPFGSYLFCSDDGAVCMDNATAVVRMLYLLFAKASISSSIEEHHLYGDIIIKISQHFLKRRIFTQAVQGSADNAGMSLALQALGMENQDPTAQAARECLMMAKHMGRRPNIRSANLAVQLSKITPCRAEIEWYKAYHDHSMGYYDAFKLWAAPKRETHINMNRRKLANFWDNVIDMLRKNQLPHYFLRRGKWINAAHFYRLLVEPLDIADYYRSGKHRTQGHYIPHGRERRYKVFDRWWQEKERVMGSRRDGGGSSKTKRRQFAGLTQDSCFWARVEEARGWAVEARSERDMGKLVTLWENMINFERYSNGLIERKEISKDVLANESSYVMWAEDWKELKVELGSRIPPALPDYLGLWLRIVCKSSGEDRGL